MRRLVISRLDATGFPHQNVSPEFNNLQELVQFLQARQINLADVKNIREVKRTDAGLPQFAQVVPAINLGVGTPAEELILVARIAQALPLPFEPFYFQRGLEPGRAPNQADAEIYREELTLALGHADTAERLADVLLEIERMDLNDPMLKQL